MTSPFARPSDSRPTRSAALGCLLIGLFVATRARAEPQRPLDLRWDAPSGCPQESDVRSRIQKILGSGRHDSPLRAEGTITRIDGRFHLELVVTVGDVVGTRSLASKSCDDLAGAAAVEIGLLLHSVEAASKPSPAEASAPTGPPSTGGTETLGSPSYGTDGLSSRPTPDASRAERAPAAKSEPPRKVESEVSEEPNPTETPRRWHVLVQAPIGAVGIGPLPRPAIGFGLGLGFEYERWQLQLQGLSWQRQNVPVPGLPGYGADVDRIGAKLWACHEIRFVWFGLSPCLLAGMERVSASATGSNILPASRHIIGMSAGAGIQGRIHLASWIRLLLGVGGEVELVRPQLSINGLGPIAPPPRGDPADPPTAVQGFAPAALTGTLSLEWAL